LIDHVSDEGKPAIDLLDGLSRHLGAIRSCFAAPAIEFRIAEQKMTKSAPAEVGSPTSLHRSMWSLRSASKTKQIARRLVRSYFSKYQAEV